MKKVASLVVVYSILLSFAVPVRSQTAEYPFFKLRDAGAAPKEVARPTPTVETLGDAETNAVLARLPELPPVSVATPAESIPNAPKRPQFKGSSTEIPEIPKLQQSGNLEVLRATPSGGVAFAGDLSVTFNQPMIGIGSPERASEQVPVKLSPSIPGRWRWLGTKTLIFDADKRFPMATEFTATIPAGTKSLGGAVLKEEFTWSFQTAVPLVESAKVSSNDSSRPDAVVAIRFNQRVDPAAVLAKMNATADGKPVALRLATPAEVAADRTIADLVKNYPEKQWLAVRAADGFPLASKIVVTNEAGTPSAEGPLTMPVKSTLSFETYEPLAIETASEDFYGESETSIDVEFNNYLDGSTVTRDAVSTKPGIPNMDVRAYGSSIVIVGDISPDTEYKVTLAPTIGDRFGQKLGLSKTVGVTFTPRDPELSSDSDDGSTMILDPAAKRTFAIHSVNYPRLHIRLRRVSPDDYASFVRHLREPFSADRSMMNVGTLVVDRVLRVNAKPNEDARTLIDLSPALTGGIGHVIVECFPENPTGDDRVEVWVQVTNLALDAFIDEGFTHFYASSLLDGKPLGGVAVNYAGLEQATSAANGLGVVATPRGEDSDRVLIARRGADGVVIHPLRETVGRPEFSAERLRWFIFDDRHLYRPGETISLKGYLRRGTPGTTTDIAEAGEDFKRIDYSLFDARDNPVLSGSAPLNRFGAFDFSIRIPDNVNLGKQRLIVKADSKMAGASTTHEFEVREFRRPEFSVTASNETSGPIVAGSTAIVAAQAKYFSSGGLKDANAKWTIETTVADYAPPGHKGFNFGRYKPWWNLPFDDEYSFRSGRFEGMTNTDGIHRLAVDTAGDGEGLARVYNAWVQIADVNRQKFTATTSFVVHPADRYVGLRSARTFVTPGDKIRIESIVTDIDGALKAGARVSIVGEIKSWRRVDGSWITQTVDTQTCSLVSATAAAACDFDARLSGDFQFTATVTDDAGRTSVSRLDVTVAGDERTYSGVGELEPDSVEVIADKETYAPGETAEILVNAPYYPAEGVLTLRRNGVVRTERFTMDRPFTILRVPIEERFVPNLAIEVSLFGKTKRVLFNNANDDKLPARPAFATGDVAVRVSLDSRRLRVSAEPRTKELLPGGETAVDVAVAGPDGKPLANAEVALVAVDESVLALSDLKTGDPLDAIYDWVYRSVDDAQTRNLVRLARCDDLKFDLIRLCGANFGYGSGSGNGMNAFDAIDADRSPRFALMPLMRMSVEKYAPDSDQNLPAGSIRVRRNFDALALFSPSVVTDANGRATVAIKLPDSLTRYRITAVATNGAKLFGSTESNLTATQPLSVRPSAPRFLNLGDTAEIPVVVKNDGRVPQTIDVAIRASNINFKAGNGRRVTVPAGDRAEVRFPVTTSATGTARFQVAAVSGGASDAAEFSFPVLAPATSESFATYGTVAENGVFGENVEIPRDIYRDFGGVEVTASSTRLQDLTDAFLYLQNYPYDCSEQLSSRILSVAALAPILTEFKSASMPPRDAIDAKMNADIAILEKRQHDDGGFNYWTRDGASLPFLSLHVAHALVRASAAGYEVPPKLLEKALGYAEKIESNLALAPYDDDSRSATLAFAAYVRTLAGRGGASEARKLIAKSDLKTLTPETLGWLYAALGSDKDSAETRENLRRALLNRVAETADSASFATGFTNGDYTILASNRRHDAVALDALLGEPNAANDELLPKIANGLLAGRRRGYWTNTQENAFVLTALGNYFKTIESASPDFTTRVWLGEKFIGEAAFKGRENISRSFGVPFAALPEAAATLPFVVQKQGAGRLYYRVGMTFAPRAESVKATDNGFEVVRTIEAADDPSDMRPMADGGFAVRAGARLRVKLTLVASAPRYHVALADHLAAGFETIDASLVGAEKIETTRARVFRWYEHENLRDDRVEVFQSYLAAGVYEYEYFVRATTPGSFILPPAKAEEMYAPETFGRTASAKIIVE